MTIKLTITMNLTKSDIKIYLHNESTIIIKILQI